MTEEKTSKDEIGNEFEKLGENIRQAVQGVWESEERKRIGKEIHDGLIEIGEAFTRLGDEFVESPGCSECVKRWTILARESRAVRLHKRSTMI